jgi:uncharacterized protein (UPF0147 family)
MALKSNDSCLAKAADDEPIFVLRAQDKSAPRTVRRWASDNKATLDRAKYEEAHALADEMEAWQARTGRAKWPD